MNESTQFLMNHGDAVLFAVVFVEQAGLPVPAAPWLLAAGALSAGGHLNPALAVALTVLACVTADWIWFYIGRRGGQRVLRWFCRMSLAPNACVMRTQGLFGRHGVKGLAAAKFIPGLGAVMPPLAGALGVSTGRFLFFDGLGSLLYGTAYIALGYLFHNQIEKMLGLLHDLGLGVTLMVLVLGVGYLALKYVRRVRPVPLKTGGRASSRAQTSVGTWEDQDARELSPSRDEVLIPAQPADPPSSLVHATLCRS
jgi:membrane protein DedA with SNARE-associated domain